MHVRTGSSDRHWGGAVTIGKLRIRALAFCIAAALLGSGAALADAVKVMISGGFASAYRELGPQFEEATGRKLICSGPIT
jgi:molybdate transport system substrate-binding protein